MTEDMTIDDLVATTIPFQLRGVTGRVTVRYGANEDPLRWGFGVLDQDWFSPELVRGFPVMQASVEHPSEGYAADLGWVQVVRYEVRDPGEEERLTVFDVPPQLAGSEIPFAAFGLRPTFFDAPAIGAREVTWDADTFLVYAPDAVLSRVLRAVCGFRWGYRVDGGAVSLDPLGIARPADWARNLSDLRARFTTWTFEEDPAWARGTPG
jgi:hypothetical protein